uniref:Uncharacterized protein n=1 Tax=Acrobeloides nanus TaxID=290746 RepID=A0A914DX40_9BILA
MSEMRPAIIKLLEKGYLTREIEQLLDVSQSSVIHARLKTSFVTTARCHHGRRLLAQCQRRMAAQQPRSQPARLHNMEHLDGESMPEAPSERGIFEMSLQVSVERNHLGRSDQDRRQLSQASPGLH